MAINGITVEETLVVSPTITRKHSIRMCTACFCGFGVGYLGVGGYTLPLDTLSLRYPTPDTLPAPDTLPRPLILYSPPPRKDTGPVTRKGPGTLPPPWRAVIMTHLHCNLLGLNCTKPKIDL